VRQSKRIKRYDQVSIIKKVQIERAWAVEFMFLRSSGFDFDAEEFGEKIEWRGLGGEFDGRVEEWLGAVRAIDGGGFVDF